MSIKHGGEVVGPKLPLLAEFSTEFLFTEKIWLAKFAAEFNLLKNMDIRIIK